MKRAKVGACAVAVLLVGCSSSPQGEASSSRALAPGVVSSPAAASGSSTSASGGRHGSKQALVVNKKNPIQPLSYVPPALSACGGFQLSGDAAAACRAMVADSGLLTPQSGYRSYDYQVQLYNNYVARDGQAAADTYSARPGYSEHQTGLAMDFAPITTSFEDTPGFAWLQSNAHRYGFILRFPNGAEATTGYNYEPWHWRYVGVEIATDMKNKETPTLEQYLGVAGGGY